MICCSIPAPCTTRPTGLPRPVQRLTKARTSGFSYLLEPQLNYRYRVGDHEIDLLVGSTYQRTKNTEMRVLGYGFESNALITNLAAANTVWVDSDVLTAYKYAALFGRINYQYKNRYILNLTGRRDGSSRFGPDNRFASFGAIGAAWLFSEESFIKERWRFLSSGKLRGSYGLTGSDLIGDYQYLDTYTVRQYRLWGQYLPVPFPVVQSIL